MFVIHVEDLKELKLFAHTIMKDSNVSSFLLDVFFFNALVLPSIIALSIYSCFVFVWFDA